MSTADVYRGKIKRKRDEIYRLKKDINNEEKKLMNSNKKMMALDKKVKPGVSESVYRNTMNALDREGRTKMGIYNKKNNLENKLMNAEKNLIDLEKHLNNHIALEKKNYENEVEKNMDNLNKDIKVNREMNINTREYVETLNKIPDEVTVLFMSSNAVKESILRLDEEVRSISEMIRKSDYRDTLKLKSWHATRSFDVLQAINQENPSIVHFSGHGTNDGKMVFIGNDYKEQYVTTDAMVQLISSTGSGIRLVLFNTCFSYNQAKEIVKYVDFAIGMSEAVSDRAAIIFAAQFYSSLGFGKSVYTAFEQAKVAVLMEGVSGSEIPKLYVKDGIDPENVYIVSVE